MADERSPLLQSRRVDDYSAVNEPELSDSVGSTDDEQQQTMVVQNSVRTLVRSGNFYPYLFYSNTVIWIKVIPMAIGIFLSAMDQTIIVACV
jgi:hypothetical protein